MCIRDRYDHDKVSTTLPCLFVRVTVIVFVWLGIAPIKRYSCSVAVSYTHLSPVCWSMTQKKCLFFPMSMPINFICKKSFQSKLCEMVFTTLKPVSYTHLDVYKRQ